MRKAVPPVRIAPPRHTEGSLGPFAHALGVVLAHSKVALFVLRVAAAGQQPKVEADARGAAHVLHGEVGAE